MKLIITADDYGMSKEVNEAIEDCIKCGTVKSTCVMVNMPCYLEITKILKDDPNVSIGMHWNVTEGHPTLPTEQVPSLINQHGLFWSKKEFQKRFILGKINKNELFEELKNQTKILSSVITHAEYWNTHQDVHEYPVIHNFFCRSAKELNYKKMRTHHRKLIRGVRKSWVFYMLHPIFAIKSIVLFIFRTISKAYGFFSSDAMLDFREFGPDRCNLWNALPKRELCGIYEINIHPANRINEPENLLISEQNENQRTRNENFYNSRYKEWNTFSDPKNYQRLLKIGIVFASFFEVGTNK